MLVFSMLHDQTDTAMLHTLQGLTNRVSLIREGVLPWYIEVLSVVRLFTNQASVILRLENVRDASLASSCGEGQCMVNLCELFIRGPIKVLARR